MKLLLAALLPCCQLTIGILVDWIGARTVRANLAHGMEERNLGKGAFAISMTPSAILCCCLPRFVIVAPATHRSIRLRILAVFSWSLSLIRAVILLVFPVRFCERNRDGASLSLRARTDRSHGEEGSTVLDYLVGLLAPQVSRIKVLDLAQ